MDQAILEKEKRQNRFSKIKNHPLYEELGLHEISTYWDLQYQNQEQINKILKNYGVEPNADDSVDEIPFVETPNLESYESIENLDIVDYDALIAYQREVFPEEQNEPSDKSSKRTTDNNPFYELMRNISYRRSKPLSIEGILLNRDKKDMIKLLNEGKKKVNEVIRTFSYKPQYKTSMLNFDIYAQSVGDGSTFLGKGFYVKHVSGDITYRITATVDEAKISKKSPFGLDLDQTEDKISFFIDPVGNVNPRLEKSLITALSTKHSAGILNSKYKTKKPWSFTYLKNSFFAKYF